MCFIPRRLTRLLPLRQSALWAGLQRCCFLASGSSPLYLLEYLPFFQKSAALCLEKTGWPFYLQVIRTKLVLIMIIIRKNAGFKRFTAF